ncbi:hypothetical protein PENSPDRAFT_180531 [Peniophora sp. CONT]|nr:hypothetical protein PENSPDRAFT_180531 [Peniophora sp. CONT]
MHFRVVLTAMIGRRSVRRLLPITWNTRLSACLIRCSILGSTRSAQWRSIISPGRLVIPTLCVRVPGDFSGFALSASHPYLPWVTARSQIV